MKILVIYGTTHVGNTHRAVEVFKKQLLTYDNFEFNEVNLPKDLPNFCLGCHNCIKTSETLCNSSTNIKLIVDKICESDAVIISSPVYVMGMTSSLKNLFDHLAYSWLPHRPNPNFFGKNTVVICTSAGSGLIRTINDIKRNLKWLGFKTKFSVGIPVFAWSWDTMPSKNKKENKVKKCADHFYKHIKKDRLPKKTIFFNFFMKLFAKMISNYSDDSAEKQYWKLNNWLD